MKKYFNIDKSSIIVMVITLILFVGAIITKGFTHDLLLEAGIFLVSVKLIIMARSNNISNEEIEKNLKEIKELLEKKLNNIFNLNGNLK